MSKKTKQQDTMPPVGATSDNLEGAASDELGTEARDEGEAVVAPPVVAPEMLMLARFPTQSDHGQRYAHEAARALVELGWKTLINQQGAESCLWVWKEPAR